MENLLPKILPGLLYFIPQVIITIACILNVRHKNNSSGILLLIGAIIGLLGAFFYKVAVPILIQQLGTEILSGPITIFTFATPISFIGAILFAIGLLLFVQEKIRMHQTTNKAM